MYQLNISHSGDYHCHIRHSNSISVSDTVIHLSVTANYSQPAVTVYRHKDGSSCLVTCASHGGYPEAKMVWNVPSGQMWNTVNSSEKSDQDTMTFNSSSTAIFNCSKGEIKLLSCSVADVTSNMFKVCTPWEDPPGLPKTMIAAICSVMAVCVFGGMVLLLRWKCKKGLRHGARARSTENEHEQKLKVLTQGNGGEES
ncbi:T-lymphocyte activation antigen CD80-like [Pempheris klunzingeri]|uniref:T-lymphocyte activation antigen CD80-like n=1 Tax=Pempheris klunzingeri TaxID=3127111 RepID=UPI00397F07FF